MSDLVGTQSVGFLTTRLNYQSISTSAVISVEKRFVSENPIVTKAFRFIHFGHMENKISLLSNLPRFKPLVL